MPLHHVDAVRVLKHGGMERVDGTVHFWNTMLSGKVTVDADLTDKRLYAALHSMSILE